jgi:hypothetical protein
VSKDYVVWRKDNEKRGEYVELQKFKGQQVSIVAYSKQPIRFNEDTLDAGIVFALTRAEAEELYERLAAALYNEEAWPDVPS